ncbi:putative reverse transcriptase domain-containing protein [Tanacetum coccineum]
MIDQGVTAALVTRDANRNGDDSHTSRTGGRRTERIVRECTYQDFMKCKPLYFKGTEGVVELTQWFERMETVFRISNCPVENQVKFSTCTLLAGALTWWNYHVMTVSHDAAYAMTWADLRKKITDEYSPRNEMKKLEAELWNFKVKEEFDKIERAYTVGTGEKKPYGGSKPVCAKCNYHYDSPCALKCHKCNKVGHFARDCRSVGNANNANNQRGTGSGQKPTCFECGVQGHYKRECPKLKNNKNRGNQVGNDRAPAKVYVVGHAGTNPDSNIVTGTFLLNNRYASILFNTGADRSFVSTAFSSQMDITPSTLDHYYDVELADGRIIGLNTILRGCTLNLLNHPFNINLMPVELGSFDAIIGMDWLAKYQAIIVCAEKIVRIPWGNETLIVHGDGSNRGHEARLHIISYSKTQEYMLKGCPVFLAHVTTNEVEDKSEKKRLEDVPIVRDFPEVFPEDLPETSKSTEEHLRLIVELLKKEELYAKFSKCEFWIPKVQFLGHMIDSKGIHVDPANIKSIKDWASPKSPTEIRQFFGLAGYYRRFIEGQKVCSAPILALPEGSEDFIAYCDASKKGLDAVLMQREKVIAYASRQLKIYEKNYTTHDLELGAVRFSLQIKGTNQYETSARCSPLS